MKNIRTRFISTGLIISILCTWIGIVPSIAQESQKETIEKFHCSATLDQEFTDNEIIIMVMPDYNFTPYTKDAFSEIGCVGVRELTRDVEESIVNRIILLTLSTHSKQNVLNAIGLLELRDDIYSAEPNYIEHICETPNDPEYNSGNQWAINKISLPDAWGETTGSSTVYVGVIDTGIDASHPDLQNRVNTELSRCFTSYFDTALEDDYGHGTEVAGVIGAESDNAIGVTGTCWNVQLVSLRVASNTGGFVVAAVIDAIEYADSVGIQILNYSGGGYNYTTNVAYRQVAIQQYSGLFICAAGNEASDNNETPYYPSDHNNLSNVISVAASDSNDEKCSFSNYGVTKVDLFAPGEGILTTVTGNGYSAVNGTSFAAPYVAGVAALLLSANPNLLPCEIKTIIINNDDDVGALSGKCVSGGRLNAYKALTHIQEHPSTYSGAGADEHIRTCIEHQLSTTIPHSFSNFVSAKIGFHMGTCTDCGYSKLLAHQYTEFYDNGSLGHLAICGDCRASTTLSHSLTCSSSGNASHTHSCEDCTYTLTESHTLHYFNAGLTAGHTATCIGCGYSYEEFHTWETVGVKYRCTKCKVTSTQVPVLPFNLPPEILAKLEQMGYVGDFAMDIGGGTVLCRVGADYYLVRGQTVDTALSHLQYELSVILPDHEAA